MCAAEVNEELHVVFFIFFRDDGGTDAEVRSEFDKFHVFGEFAFGLHLLEILIIFLSIFRIGDFDHVLVEKAHELRFFHGLLDFFEFVPSHVFEFEICGVLLGRCGFHWDERECIYIFKTV